MSTTRLGKRQLDRLAMMANVGCALVVPDDISRALCKRGLMLATGDRPVPGRDPGFVVITSDGFRALADAMDADLVRWKPDLEAIRKRIKTTGASP